MVDVAPASDSSEAGQTADGRRWIHLIDILVVLLLGLASMLATWAGYQAGQWSSLKASSAVIVEDMQQASDRATILGYQDRQVDIALFMAWLEADLRDEHTIAAFYEERFVDRFRPAFEAWLAADPFTNPDAPLDPFRMPEYAVPSLVAAVELDARAGEIAAAGEEFDAQANAYVFLTVLTAVVLFFGGVATKLDRREAQVTLLAVAWLMLGYCIVQGLTMPWAADAVPGFSASEMAAIRERVFATPVR
ncbi:MAG: hypothetical protein R2853_06330 [Thermomicrobiales bacterium]|nr:hypothetical protein [Thermomicrobiales bacterium]